MTANRLLITQALDERALLVKKINDKIDNAALVDVKKRNEEKALGSRQSPEEFRKKAESSYQQITDLIDRYQKIDAAIVASNAATIIETTYGIFTVAAAISLRNRLRSTGTAGAETDFERKLEQKMMLAYKQSITTAENKNRALHETAESMRLSILGKESKIREEKPLEVVEAYVKENTMELVDPLDIRGKIESSREKRETLLAELETQIKVSNATHFIEI